MVIRTEKLTNYTKIDNNYLEDKNISLKAKGLCLLCKEGKLAVTNALNELKENNYLEIEKGYDYDGKFIYEYIIYENPYSPKAFTDLPYMDN